MKSERIVKVHGSSIKKRKIGGKFMPPIYKCELAVKDLQTYQDYQDMKIDEKLQEHFDKLEKSMKKFGVVEPLFVWNMFNAQHDQDYGYYVVIGNSRLHVAKKLKLKTLPCLVVNNRGNGSYGSEHTEGERLETENDVKACFKNKDIRFIYKDNVIFTMNMGFSKDFEVEEDKPVEKKVAKKTTKKKDSTPKKKRTYKKRKKKADDNS